MLDVRDVQKVRSTPRPASEAPRPGLAARIAAATPPKRDRAVDALRALAILGVVLGHWLVTALVQYGDGQLRVASPLQAMPWLAPVSWALQTLAVFFLVGGFTAAKGYRAGSYPAWVRGRLARLARPVPALLLAWVPLTAALWYAGFSGDSLHALLKLVLSPLWFLGVYAALTALTPVAVAAWRRLGGYAVLIPVAATALVDIGRFGLGWPAQLGWINVLAGWLVPYLLGVGWAHGAPYSGRAGRRTAGALLAGGAAGTALLIGFAGYPASMVGVPGAAISNLNPPTLARVTVGLAQVGLVFLVKDRLGRWMRRPRLWAGVALANLSAMTIFLWHQSGMMLVTLAALLLGSRPGLHTVPGDLGWAADRLAWLPAFAAALAGCWALFARFERPRRHGRSGGPNGASPASVVQPGKKVL